MDILNSVAVPVENFFEIPTTVSIVTLVILRYAILAVSAITPRFFEVGDSILNLKL
jgi:hypothetical protein